MKKLLKALMVCAKILGDDNPGCIKIDSSKSEAGIKEGLKMCVNDLEKRNDTETIEKIKKLTEGFVKW